MANTGARTVTIKVTSVSGSSPQDKQVEVEATGASVQEVLKKAGLEHTSKTNLFVDGEPAVLTTHVGQGSTVSLTEKVRGS